MLAFFSSLIALAIGFIALQQYFLAREKFKLELFEKRFAIYKAVQDYLEGVRTSQDASDELIQAFLEKTNTAKFLFDADITEFIRELRGLGVRLNLAKRKPGCTTEAQLAKCEQIEKDTLREFMAHHTHFDFRFVPYMKFQKWSRAFWIDFGNQRKRELDKKEQEYQTFRKEIKDSMKIKIMGPANKTLGGRFALITEPPMTERLMEKMHELIKEIQGLIMSAEHKLVQIDTATKKIDDYKRAQAKVKLDSASDVVIRALGQI